MTHTGGNWRSEGHSILTDKATIAMCCKYSIKGIIPNEQISANAKLIAAAPDLLKACIAAIKISDETLPDYAGGRSDECQAVYNLVKAAILKAIE